MEWSEEVDANGFAIRHGVVSPDWMNQTLNDDIRRSPMRSRAGLRHAMLFGSVRLIAGCPQLKQLACEVLGPRAFPFRATLFDKSPAANWLVVWHQDTALPLRQRIDLPGWGPWSLKEGGDSAHAHSTALGQGLALRVSCDDSTLLNGPLRVLPGTHALGVVSDDSLHELSTRVA